MTSQGKVWTHIGDCWQTKQMVERLQTLVSSDGRFKNMREALHRFAVDLITRLWQIYCGMLLRSCLITSQMYRIAGLAQHMNKLKVQLLFSVSGLYNVGMILWV